MMEALETRACNISIGIMKDKNPWQKTCRIYSSWEPQWTLKKKEGVIWDKAHHTSSQKETSTSWGYTRSSKFEEISTPTPVISFPYHSMHLVLILSMIKILKSGNNNNFLKTQI